MASTLAQLLAAKTRDEREAQLLAALNTGGFPVTDWYVGSVGRTILKMLTTGLVDFDDLVPLIASGGFLGPFQVGDAVYPARDWLELEADQRFNMRPAPATYTKQRITLYHQPGTGPTVIASVGQLTAVSAYGNQYSSVTLGTVVAGTTPATALVVDFQAQSPGSAFNRDIAGTITTLVSPLPGLIVVNQNLDFGGLDAAGRAQRVGSGTGTVTPQQTVPGTSPTGARTFTILITNAGQVGAAIASMVVDDGFTKTTVPLSPIPASYNAGSGATIAFANGAQNPSFIAGESYTFQTPGSPIINPGSDAESSDSLRARCRGRWPSLADIPTADRYAGWITQCSIDNGFGITKTTVNASATIAGNVDIRVATASGAVSGGVLASLQAYVDLRDGIVDKGSVLSAVNQSVTAAATVTVRSALAATVKLQAKTNWETYIANLPIGGYAALGGVVVLEELVQAIMDAGAADVSAVTLNGAAANLALTSIQVAVAANSIDTALTWLEVP